MYLKNPHTKQTKHSKEIKIENKNAKIKSKYLNVPYSAYSEDFFAIISLAYRRFLTRMAYLYNDV